MKPIIKETKKAKKKFNWSGFFRYFRTFWKNDACVECSIVPRKKNNYTGAKYWWVSIPVFLASITLAMTPLTVHASQKTGSTLLANKTFNIDQVLYSAFYQNDANKSYIEKGGSLDNVHFENGEATFTLDKGQTEQLVLEGKVNYLGYHKGLLNVTENNQVEPQLVKDFEFYFIKDVSAKDYKDIISKIDDDTYPFTDNKSQDVNFEGKEKRTHTSYIAFSKTEFILRTCGNNEKASYISGDYKHIGNASFKDIVTKGVKADDTYKTSLDKIMTNFKGLADNVYETKRSQLTGASSGISLGVNGGIVILLGFILFFLTRGKQNPFRYITCYETLNMAMWATFLPGLLALIFGFIFPGMEMMLFLITFGFRCMWMAMRSLRPQTY